MRLASYLVDGAERWGFVVDEPATGRAWVVEPARAEAFLVRYASIPSSGVVASRPWFRGDDWPATLVEFLALEDDGMAALSRLVAYVQRFVAQSDATLLPRAGSVVENVELLAPVPRPRLYWGLVANAPSFVRNNPNTRLINLFPLGHQRPQGAAVGPGAPVTFRNGNHLPLMAYNVELGVVIGKAGRYVPLERAMDHVAGYTVVNDVSGTYYYGIVPGNAGRGYALPERYSDWLYQVTASWGGKKADTLAPMGPFLVTKDEVGDPYNLLMYTRQTGRTRDRAHSGATLLGIERVISWYSSFASLYPGDVIHFATMGVDGLPVFPDDVADPDTRLEAEIEHVGTLLNPVAVAKGPVPLVSHPSYAVREVATSGSSALDAGRLDGRVGPALLHVVRQPRDRRGRRRAAPPRRSAVPQRPGQLAGCRRIRGRDPAARHGPRREHRARRRRPCARGGRGGLARGRARVPPLVSLCDRSFADAVVEPARTGERGIPAMYGRWADGFNVVGDALVPLPEHDWRGRAMSLEVGDRVVSGSTSAYLAGPGDLIATISAMITLFPGDVITLGWTAARLVLTRDEYEAGVVVRGAIEGLGEVRADLAPHGSAVRA